MTFPRIHRDYETRSELDLKKVGAHVYAMHPSTKLLCAVWIVEWTPGILKAPVIWRCDDPQSMPSNISELIKQGFSIVVGHNAAFEAAMDRYHTAPKLGWLVPELHDLDCTMARAAAQALPLGLDQLAIALNFPHLKDKEGHRLMLQMCKPRRPKKVEPRDETLWHFDTAKLDRLVSYCLADVRAEIEADHRLRPLQAEEQEVWRLDQIMNNRGIEIDLDFVRLAREKADLALARANERILAVTHGAVSKVTQVARIKTFAKAHGVVFAKVEKVRRSGEKYETESVDKEAITDLLEVNDETDWDTDALPGLSNLAWKKGDPPSVRATLELRLEAGKSSLKKLDRFLAQAPEGRSRGNLQYHAAAPGRWGGRGAQLQNLVRRGISEPGGWPRAYEDMRTLPDDVFEMTWGSPLDVIARMMRGVLIAKAGHKLFYGDYASVEARGCVWAAEQNNIVELFASGGKVYEATAAVIFGVDVADVTPDQRFLGKGVVLGCGYGMGVPKFIKTCKKQGRIISPELAERAVHGWRELNKKVCQFWYQLETAAFKAITRPNDIFEAGPFTYRCLNHWLQCRLPSGRLIWYRDPSVKPTKEDIEAAGWRGAKSVSTDRWKIHYWGVNPVTKQWTEETTWGGKLLENCIQGMCRDFLAEALLRLEGAGYPVVLSVHDEAICEAPIGFGSIEEFIQLMQMVPAWAPGFPLRADGGTGFRYAKA